MALLCLDLATVTGWCLVPDRARAVWPDRPIMGETIAWDPHLAGVRWGEQRLTSSSVRYGRTLDDLFEWLRLQIRTSRMAPEGEAPDPIGAIYLEAPIAKHASQNSAAVALGLRALCHFAAVKARLPIPVEVASNTVRVTVVGSGRAEKGQIVESVQRLGFPIAGKQHNAADAIALAHHVIVTGRR